MTDLETQVRAALDQLAAMVKHDGFCSAGECLRCRETNQRPDLHHPCTCNREVRLRAAWSQATTRYGDAILVATRMGESVTAANAAGVAALREGEAHQ